MPVITALVAQKRNSSRVSVFLDGEFAFGCERDIIEQFHLAKGQELSAETLKVLQAEEHTMQLKQAAYRYISYKPRTSAQVRQKILLLGYTEAEVAFALQFLEDLGYLNDDKYARLYIHDAQKLKHYSLNRIRLELKKRGLPKDTIERAIHETISPEDQQSEEQANVKRAAEKKLRSIQHHDKKKRQQLLIAYLQRQGFSWSIIKPVLAELMDTTDDLNLEEF